MLPQQRQDETTTRTILTTREEVQAATAAVASTAKRLMAIYTGDLEPALYDQPRFIETVKRLVLASGFARVRVLLADPTRAMYESSKFIALARRITSYIEIRHLNPRLRSETPAFLIADDRAIVYRLQAARWDGICDLNDPAVARLYLNIFDEAWTASAPDAETRQQHL